MASTEMLTLKEVRKWNHLAIVACLLAAFAHAPLRHSHDEDAGHDHFSEGDHAHWVHVHDDDGDDDHAGPVIADADEDSDARLEEWFAGDGKSPAPFAICEPARFVARPMPSVVAVSVRPAPQVHDPPWRTPLHPRAPPA